MLPPNQERVGQLVPASNGCSLRHGASRPNTFCGFGERHYTSINSVLNTPPNQATIVHDHHLTENIARVGFNYHLGAPVVAKYQSDFNLSQNTQAPASSPISGEVRSRLWAAADANRGTINATNSSRRI